jgi:phosphate:Na+ symporter
VAVAFLLLNGLGAAIVFPLAGLLEPAVAWSGAEAPRQIANAHTFFNLALLVVFLPLAGPITWVVRRLVPEPRRAREPVEEYLDPIGLQSPPVAIGQATRAVLRMAEIVQGMLRDLQRALESNDEALVLEVRDRDDEVDRMHQLVRAYLTRLAADQRFDEETSDREIGLLYAVGDLEDIGDVLDRNLADVVLKKIHGGHQFSEEGSADLRAFHQRVSYEFARAVSALATSDVKLAGEVIVEKDEVSRLERELRRRHIQRLHDGRVESIDSSDIHLDVLSNLERVNAHATNLAFVVWGRT